MAILVGGVIPARSWRGRNTSPGGDQGVGHHCSATQEGAVCLLMMAK